MEWIGTITLTAVFTAIIVLIVYCESRKTIKRLRSDISALRDRVAEKDEEVAKVKLDALRYRRLLEELLIVSSIGYNPSIEARREMVNGLLDDKKFINDNLAKISSYRTKRGLEVAHHLNEIGRICLDIYDSLLFSLTSSISGNRSLYQEFVDYFYNYGFTFLGKKKAPEGQVPDCGEVVIGHVDE